MTAFREARRARRSRADSFRATRRLRCEAARATRPRTLCTAACLASLATACQPDCDALDLLFADGIERPEPAPDAADTFWLGGNGGISARSDNEDLAIFEPLYAHLVTGTSSTAGRVRWAIVLGRDRVLVVEHALPLERDRTIDVDTLVDDLEFTGGGRTPTWWNTDWRWTEGSTVAPPRAVFTAAFERTLTAEAVEGTIEVRQVQPVELRLGLLFRRTDGGTEAYWGGVEFDGERGFDPCR